MKAILVMDMPSSCLECPIGKDMSIPIETCIKCPFGKCVIDEEVMKRPDWCPIKPIPEKKSEGETLKIAIENDCYDGTTEDKAYFAGYDKGYNACIDEILGDKE